MFDLAEWHLDHNDKWSIKDVTGKRTPWLQESKRRLHPVHITLGPGDGLYLPSLWFHKVHQEEEQLEGMKACIAVNYWYDMDYSDARFSYFELIRALKSFD